MVLDFFCAAAHRRKLHSLLLRLFLLLSRSLRLVLFNIPSRGSFCLLCARGQQEVHGCPLKCCAKQAFGRARQSTFMAFAAILASFSFVAFALLQSSEQGRVLFVGCQWTTRNAWLSLKVLLPGGPSRAPKGGKARTPSPGWRWR